MTNLSFISGTKVSVITTNIDHIVPVTIVSIFYNNLGAVKIL